MDEFEIINRFFARPVTDEAIAVGIGDDGAVLRPAPGRDLLTVVDTTVCGVHFPETLAADAVGYRAVAVNVSDIAAMGGRPRWMTLALTLREADPAWLDAFAAGVFEAADTWDVTLVGGDTTHGGELVVSVQVIGDVEAGTALTRAGARPGDAIYVSGTPGDAAAGLSLLQSGGPAEGSGRYLVDRFLRPGARVALGQQLRLMANAAIDVSDGLYTDIEKLLATSGVAGRLDLDAVPMSPEILSLVSAEDAMRFALTGGDDYELCFTASEEALGDGAELAGVRVTRIGRVSEGSGLSCALNGEPYSFHDDGYRHFR